MRLLRNDNSWLPGQRTKIAWDQTTGLHSFSSVDRWGQSDHSKYHIKNRELSPKRQNPGDRMTQSHLPGTGRGAIEAVSRMLQVLQHQLLPAFSNENAGFFVFQEDALYGVSRKCEQIWNRKTDVTIL